ncbi:MAG: 3'-5' exonuclease [Anaerolineaceae bacterium]|jgi:DNA polymerase III epsilon subunit-like protein
MVISSSARQNAILRARQALSARPVYLDTETTGLDPKDEIVEISIVDEDGSVLLEKFVRPSMPIPREATRIHGITDENVKSAMPWPILWREVRPILAGRLIVIYNAEFDLRMMRQSMTKYRQPWNEKFDAFDLMKVYAEFRSEWDVKRQSYHYFSLDAAGKHARIALPNAHRATADSLLTRALLHHIAEAQA